jgi:hypothetical protein
MRSTRASLAAANGNRAAQRFRREGLIQVHGRVVKLLDKTVLRQILNGAIGRSLSQQVL